MDPIYYVLGLLAAGCAAAAVWMAVLRGRAGAEAAAARAESAQRLDYVNKLQGAWDEREAEVVRLRAEVVQARAELNAAVERHATELAHLERIGAERLGAVQREKAAIELAFGEMRTKASETFRSLAAEALSQSSKDFLSLAETKLKAQQQAGAAELETRRVSFEQLVKPIAETLQKTDAKLGQIETERAASFGKLSAELTSIGRAGELLREETGKLVRALREPHVRGRYGELQLKRVAELAGMSRYCDFTEQEQTTDADGNPLKPDMVVRLPSERVVVVDAKTNIKAYLEALEAATPAEAEACLDRFARHVAEQATALARKKYWAQYDGSPEFVVMFIPGDQFIDAALSRQPDILERAASQNVLLVGPASLIGLLRAVHVGYKEQRLAQAAEELRDLGIEFHERAATAFAQVVRLGSALNGAVDRYNDFVGSYEKRLEPTLRKFEEAGARSGKELPEVMVVDSKARTVQPEAALLPEES